jgi:phosphatidate cytidylyltransferase
MFFSHSIKKISFFFSIFSSLFTASISLHAEFPVFLLMSLSSFVMLSFLLYLFYAPPSDDSVHSLSFSSFGTFYVGILMGFIGCTFSNSLPVQNGRYFVFLLLLSTFLGDTFAYFFGHFFGKHKLAPRISPNKTWEGAFGGLLASVVSGLLVRFFFLPQISIFLVLFFAFMLSFFCQVGDLSESFIKRGIGVKDSSNIIPGHGGLLDRIDALLFGAPVVYFFSLIF